MNRAACLESLIRFERPLEQIKSDLLRFEWDSDELVTLSRLHVRDVLARFLNGALRPDSVAEWAETIEGREDIALEPGHEKLLSEAIFALANPDINEPINTDVCQRWQGRLDEALAVSS